jgi:hypothetical protein
VFLSLACLQKMWYPQTGVYTPTLTHVSIILIILHVCIKNPIKMFVLEYKKHQLPFHKKESKYYKLQPTPEDIVFYTQIYHYALQGIKQFTEIPPPTGYTFNSFYYRFYKHLKRRESSPPSEYMETPGLYTIKIGRRWYIYIKR